MSLQFGVDEDHCVLRGIRKVRSGDSIGMCRWLGWLFLLALAAALHFVVVSGLLAAYRLPHPYGVPWLFLKTFVMLPISGSAGAVFALLLVAAEWRWRGSTGPRSVNQYVACACGFIALAAAVALIFEPAEFFLEVPLCLAVSGLTFALLRAWFQRDQGRR